MLEQLKALNLDLFNLTSIIDILIVAFVLYRLILLIKGTRAVQLLKGLAVLLVATALSSWLHLYTFHWLLRQVMTALVVALPIVFQPELRRALEKLGGGRFFTSSLIHQGEDDRSRTISQVVRAASLLSRQRIGALIVLERTTGLEEYIDTGIKIDGLVTAELLLNIFEPNTPLHDGAVIIRGDRVASAACLLPLTESPDVARGLGTRHRAGIGVTEVSDALAVIVSEETGIISLAVEGVLARNLDEPALADRLAGAFEPQKGRSLAFLWLRKQ
ncbi:diadenylate cyclase CdaA [Desulfofundulus thermosubterraneus]|uniref:Diadenylate cyclase n=1 Tax=Desulfofundulus thermosubterraneus DSM 16057 TaxID=1121432 RepID=A0A1M6E4L7_9FIRM|nr:diadenylate cyclase CdaA [Desulfofundulus thermosubterraneus]SHI80437.1 diadenylate cyclase [Desulfofundulus thermosubterraneus DSM 16057]